jgi:hypothetical protein
VAAHATETYADDEQLPAVGDVVLVKWHGFVRRGTVLARRGGSLLDLHVDGVPDAWTRGVGRDDVSGWRPLIEGTRHG